MALEPVPAARSCQPAGRSGQPPASTGRDPRLRGERPRACAEDMAPTATAAALPGAGRQQKLFLSSEQASGRHLPAGGECQNLLIADGRVSNCSPSVLPSPSQKQSWLPLRGHHPQGLTRRGWLGQERGLSGRSAR